MEDVKKLVNDLLHGLRVKEDVEDALHKEVYQVNISPFTNEIEQAAPPRSVMILYKGNDALMCKVFTMTLRGAAQNWVHTLVPKLISSFRELALTFMKEYTSY